MLSRDTTFKPLCGAGILLLSRLLSFKDGSSLESSINVCDGADSAIAREAIASRGRLVAVPYGRDVACVALCSRFHAKGSAFSARNKTNQLLVRGVIKSMREGKLNGGATDIVVCKKQGLWSVDQPHSVTPHDPIKDTETLYVNCSICLTYIISIIGCVSKIASLSRINTVVSTERTSDYHRKQ